MERNLLHPWRKSLQAGELERVWEGGASARCSLPTTYRLPGIDRPEKCQWSILGL
jgi:hypothetical protein